MIYGQLQYYNDELKAWVRIIDFHKSELHELMTQLHVMLNFPVVSLPDSKGGNAFVDQLMVQDQRFEHLRQHIEHQSGRLEHSLVAPGSIEPLVIGFQESCRVKMKTYEIAFIRTRYDCLLFLSAFFQPNPAAVLVK